MTLNIAGVEIGQGHPCRFVAEISNNHNGSLDRALRLIDAAKSAGADFVKFQCYTPDELIALRGDGPAPEPWASQGFTMRTLYEKAQTPLGWFPQLVAHCAAVGIPWFSSVFGMDSLAMLESIDCPAYKIARLDHTQKHLLDAVSATRKPRLVSTDNRYSLTADPDGRFFGENFLYCAPGYPSPADEFELPVFEDADGYVYYLGLSSHCLDPLLPIAAVARGCKLIEMHFMLDDEPSELEANVSLTASQFGTMVRRVREVEAMLA